MKEKKISRSYRKPYHVLTKQIDKDSAHKAVRRRVKMELQKEDPDLLIVNGGTRELGKEEWGTKFGYEFMDGLSEEERKRYTEDMRKASRK